MTFTTRLRGLLHRTSIHFNTLAVAKPGMAPATMDTRRRSVRLSSTANGKASPELMPPPPPAAPQNKRKRKTPSEPTDETGTQAKAVAKAKAAAPVTPTKRRAQASSVSTPPMLTPTPSGASLFAQPAAAVDGGGGARAIGKPRRPDAVNRLADPRLSNAPLLSPETSRLVASRMAESVSPSKPSSGAAYGGGATRMTTRNLLQEANEHLVEIDERMRPLVEKNHCRVFSPEGLAERIDPFESLTSGIISQQVSGAAAKSIKAKFVALFSPNDEPNADGATRFPHPSEVAACTIEHLRTAGLSQRKAEYIQGLADKFRTGELTAQMLHDATDDEVLEKLIAVRGLGRWSVEMFACFGLKRMDVFSLGDLGVQRGMAAFEGRDVAKLKAKGGKWKYMSEKEMLGISERFAPYRSLFMWYMWRVEETDVSTME